MPSLSPLPRAVTVGTWGLLALSLGVLWLGMLVSLCSQLLCWRTEPSPGDRGAVTFCGGVTFPVTVTCSRGTLLDKGALQMGLRLLISGP